MPDDDLLLRPPAPPETTEDRPHPLRLRIDVATVTIAFAALIISISSAAFSFLQWRAADREADNSEAQLRLVERSAAEQAGDVERARGAAEASAVAAKELVTATMQIARTGKLSAFAAAELARTANANLTVVQRARMVPDGLMSRPVAANGKVKHWDFWFQWSNQGATDAKDVLVWINAADLVKPFPDDFSYPDSGDRTGNPITAAPGSSVHTAIRTISAQHIMDAATGARSIYFWGWIAYRDEFSPKLHVTRFCRRINRVFGDATSDETLSLDWDACGDHACLDEKCPGYDRAYVLKYPQDYKIR